jgi:hypothetical protein
MNVAVAAACRGDIVLHAICRRCVITCVARVSQLATCAGCTQPAGYSPAPACASTCHGAAHAPWHIPAAACNVQHCRMCGQRVGHEHTAQAGGVGHASTPAGNTSGSETRELGMASCLACGCCKGIVHGRLPSTLSVQYCVVPLGRLLVAAACCGPLQKVGAVYGAAWALCGCLHNDHCQWCWQGGCRDDHVLQRGGRHGKQARVLLCCATADGLLMATWTGPCIAEHVHV